MTEFMSIACKEALQGILAGDGGPFGAVVIKDGQVVAAGHNMVLVGKDPTAHAEITAIRKAGQILDTHDLTGCELYTTCYPCPMCYGAIMWARISKVYYGCTKEQAAAIGFDDKVFYEAIAAPDVNNLLKFEVKDSEMCMALFEEWKRLEGRILY